MLLYHIGSGLETEGGVDGNATAVNDGSAPAPAIFDLGYESDGMSAYGSDGDPEFELEEEDNANSGAGEEEEDAGDIQEDESEAEAPATVVTIEDDAEEFMGK